MSETESGSAVWLVRLIEPHEAVVAVRATVCFVSADGALQFRDGGGRLLKAYAAGQWLGVEMNGGDPFNNPLTLFESAPP